MHRMAQCSYSQLLHYGLFYDYRNPYFIWGLNWIYFPPFLPVSNMDMQQLLSCTQAPAVSFKH